MYTVSRFLFRGRQNVRVLRADVRTGRPVFPPRRPPGWFSAGSRGKSCRKRLPFQGPIPPIRGKCPEGTKGVGMLSPKVTERLLHICGDLSVSASPSHLPWKGRLWDRACQGFPYEGKAFFCYIHSGRISMPCLAAKRRVEAVPPGVPSKTEMRREALCTMARLRRSMQPGV